MLSCILVIIIILVILLITGMCYYSSYSNQNYIYYDGKKYYRGDSFNNRFKKLFNKSNFQSDDSSNKNNAIISTANDIPTAFRPYQSAQKAVLNRNILAAQGNAIPEMYRWQNGASGSSLPEFGGQDQCINESDCIGKGSSYKCSGLGDSTTCTSSQDNFQAAPAAPGTLAAAKQSSVENQINGIKNNDLMFGKNSRSGSALSNLANQPNLPRGLSANNRSGAKTTPEEMSMADQEQWLALYMDAKDPNDIPSLGNDLPSSTKIPTSDYNSFITNLVADPRLMENHQKWSEEMFPWSGTAFSPDDMDETIGNSLSFVGLRRPQATAQGSDSLFITEVDATNIIDNPRFNFMGNVSS